MSRGGIESFMMNYYRYFDKEKIQVDFIVHGFEKGVYDDEITNMGGRIYNVPVKSKDYFGNVNALNKIFSSGKYKIVHSHMDAMSMVVLKQAKKCGISIRIAHSHNTQHLTNNRIKYLLNEYARKNVSRYATHYVACSEPAARWLFGNENVDDNKVIYIKNAIDLDKYKFDNLTRENIRREYDLKNEFVIGHVGRFDYQKNHFFLLDIFKDILKVQPNARLFLIGDGHLRNKIETKILELNIKDKVILAGIKDDVDRIMNAFDVFCLPSHFEGLGIVLVEAQTNGLMCITSNEVPREVNISGETQFISLNAPIEKWVNSLLDVKENINRNINYDYFINAGYSIVNESQRLENIYLKLSGVKA
ncbi:glycosyltransferase family 1 protein [Psychrobacillus sp. NPDC093180]|uniref:glycosyltransferase family 1 protein n=1 Tax=Psychrobacillus sp. NPDC093180 TaxID=3364489 RepID=UPI0038271F45